MGLIIYLYIQAAEDGSPSALLALSSSAVAFADDVAAVVAAAVKNRHIEFKSLRKNAQQKTSSTYHWRWKHSTVCVHIHSHWIAHGCHVLDWITITVSTILCHRLR